MTERNAKSQASGDGRDETPEERADRNLSELLQELRVALPGVQVLFAFLLTVPFSQGFLKLTADQRELYFAVLMLTAVSTAFLIAPSAYHRLLFRQRDKTHLVIVANRLSIIGLGVLALAITGAVLLVADIIFKGTPTVVFTAFIAVLLALLWAIVPLIRRSRLDRSEREP